MLVVQCSWIILFAIQEGIFQFETRDYPVWSRFLQSQGRLRYSALPKLGPSNLMWMEERDESRPADIEGALHNYKRKCCLCFLRAWK